MLFQNGNNTNADLHLTVDETVTDDLTSEPIVTDSMVATIHVDNTEIHSIIIDCSTISYVDSVGVKTLGQVRREGRKEMFYLTTHSTHFIYGYMASYIW